MAKRAIEAACLFLWLLSGAIPVCAQEKAGTSRQAEVARMGERVMPFDLARTTHYFEDTATGGLETVTANDAGDSGQIGLIRSHLQHEATRFARGDFSDPAKIHGSHMPGLATLATAGDKLHVSYRTLPGGASLIYTSGDAAVIEAVHTWFFAQRSDHAAHGHHHP